MGFVDLKSFSSGAAREIGGDAAAEFVDKLGLKDLVGILENPPPGVDELVALSEVTSARELNFTCLTNANTQNKNENVLFFSTFDFVS